MEAKLNFYLTKSLADSAKRLAKETGLSVADVIRLALREYLDKAEKNERKKQQS